MKEIKKIIYTLLIICLIFLLSLLSRCKHKDTEQSTSAKSLNTYQASTTELITEEIVDKELLTLFFELLEEKAQIMLENEFTYGNTHKMLEKEIEGNRRSNCATYISYVLQDMDVIPKGTMFYCHRDVTLKGSAAKTLMESEYFDILYPDETVEDVVFEPGDIVGIAGKKWQHTMVFVGYREDGRMLWYSGGNDATMRDSKQFSPKKLGVARRVTCYENKHCIMILRWKNPKMMIPWKVVKEKSVNSDLKTK